MLSFYTTRTNELTVALQQESNQEPLGGATVTAELRLNGVAIAGTHVILTEISTGNYYTKYPILSTVKKNLKYTLHIKVVTSSNETVIDEDYPYQVPAI